MVYRLTWIAGSAGILLALARMQRLFRDAPGGPPWEAALLASAVLGAVVTWLIVSYGGGWKTALFVNAGALIIASVRIAAADTTWLLLPTPASAVRMAEELSFAWDILRHGTAPVLPVAGLLVVVSAAFWGLGALLSWGLLRGRPYVALVPPFVLYLQLATLDWKPGGASWTLAALLVAAGSLAALHADEAAQRTGRLRRATDRLTVPGSSSQLAAGFVAMTTVVALVLAGPLVGLVPVDGSLDWRTGGGLGGDFFGSVRYNPFISIRQQLIAQSPTPVFVARISGEVDPSRTYWKLLSLDSFNGTTWFAEQSTARFPESGRPWEDSDMAFAGPTRTVVADVSIEALSNEWLPSIYSPVALATDAEILANSYRVREDGSLRFDALTYRGLSYRLTAQVPDPDESVLVSLGPDSLSPVFRRAAQAGESVAQPTSSPIERRELPDEDHFLQLPDGIDPRIMELAREVTRNTLTPYEKGLALESWFRERGTFRYSTDIDPGHSAGNVAAWLLEDDSPNFRTGYCEQFATAMAVMARTIGVPSRTVIGFTPGEHLGDGLVIVRDRNAHAWVELWMPSQGWVRFDPTPRSDGVNPASVEALAFDPRAYLDVPESDVLPPLPGDQPNPFEPDFAEDVPDAGTAPPPQGTGFRITVPGPLWIVVLAALLLAAPPAAKAWRRRRRLARLRNGDISAAWNEIVDRLADLGARVDSHLTPVELARATEDSLVPLAHLYTEAVYGPTATLAPAKVVTANDSFRATETRIADRFRPIDRLIASYSTRSVRWLRRKKTD